MKRVLLVAVLVLGPAVSGCAALQDRSSPGLQVVASIYPIAYLADEIAGPEHVDLLTTPGVEPHDFELTIAETARIADSDLAIYDRGLQPAVDEAIDDNAGGLSLDASRVTNAARTGDPHFWMNPRGMANLAYWIGQKLSDLYPSRARYYEHRALLVSHQMIELDDDYLHGFANCRTNTIVVSHEAYDNLRRYGLSVEAIAGLTPEDPPTPAHLAQLQDLIRTRHITTVFTEPLGNFKIPDALYGDLGVKIETLDPIEGQTDPQMDYVDVMQSNLAKIQEANGCSP